MPLSTLRTHPDPKAKWSRVVLATLSPVVDDGRWPVRRALGETVEVVAGCITDGHDRLAVELEVTAPDGTSSRQPMPMRYNDEYSATFATEQLGFYTYRVQAWMDTFGTWLDQFRRRVDGGESEEGLRSELLDGAALLEQRAKKAKGEDAKFLKASAARFKAFEKEAAFEPAIAHYAAQYDLREGLISSDSIRVEVDSVRTRFSAWYEFFPRSSGDTPGEHATLDDAAQRLAGIKTMGFDVVYLPPIHPVGVQFRKGKDNNPTAEPGEPGSPWAIGGYLADGSRGGHKDVAVELGGMPAFERFMDEAKRVGIEIALDIAFQCSPDHPYVIDHPEWFKHRPDGTIRYAENPPKKYQDVYPFDFTSEAWPALWEELKSVFTFWVEKGVTLFRVDNPHTKPFAFWEWCIREIKASHPDTLFLAEAFSRPRIMQGLAKIGFTNSYTYYAWRNSAQEMRQYGEELFLTDQAEYFRPNFWPNTPDIFTDWLAENGRRGHILRFVVAATLSPTYGIYGPPYEHVVLDKHPVREEYSNNEKYEVRTWNWSDPNSLQSLFTRINRIRHEQEALQFTRPIQFLNTSNANLLAFAKHRGKSRVVVVANFNMNGTEEGFITLDPASIGLDPFAPFTVHDALGGETYTWQGTHHYIKLNPHVLPAHVFVVYGTERA